jgi:hypothetical protein
MQPKKERMIQPILADYLRGNFMHPKASVQHHAIFASFIECMDRNSFMCLKNARSIGFLKEYKLDLRLVNKHPNKIFIQPDVSLDLMEKKFSRDITKKENISLLEFCWDYQQFLKDRKSYIFSRSLTQSLQKAKARLPFRYMPEEFCAIFTFKGMKIATVKGDQVVWLDLIGVLVRIKRDNEGHWLDIFLFMDQEYDTMRFITLNLNEEIEGGKENFEDTSKATINELLVAEPNAKKEALESLASILRSIFNSIAYVTHANEDLIIEENEFSKKEKKSKIQKKIYSHSRFIKVGEGFEHIRMMSKDSTSVQGHIRMQPCGPGLSKIKLIWVNEHERNYPKKIISRKVEGFELQA